MPRSPYLADQSSSSLQEATLTAQTVREHAVKSRGTQPVPGRPGKAVSPSIHSRFPAYPMPVSHWKRLLSCIQLPQSPLAILIDATTWVAAATLLRVGMKFALTTFPVLWLPIAILMVTPALLTVYLAIFVPKSGFVPGYRLLLIILGFLIGGTL